jgi:hypothetical protein
VVFDRNHHHLRRNGISLVDHLESRRDCRESGYLYIFSSGYCNPLAHPGAVDRNPPFFNILQGGRELKIAARAVQRSKINRCRVMPEVSGEYSKPSIFSLFYEVALSRLRDLPSELNMRYHHVTSCDTRFLF